MKAIELLQEYGKLEKISNAWESQSIGAEGPNYLNACVLLVTPLEQEDLKQQVLLPIELGLGRRRTADKFAPRTIDIDIVIFDEIPCDTKYWEQAFVVVPLAEILPQYKNPSTQESMAQIAARLRQHMWIERRPAVLNQFQASRSTS